MSTHTITAPNPDYNGVSAGVRFTDGKATIEYPRQAAAAEYFGRHRFGIEPAIKAKGEDSELLSVPESKVGPGVPNGAVANERQTREELDALATERGIDPSTAKTKGDLVALINAAPPVPASGATATEVQAGIGSTGTTDVAGDGPAGPLHNQGHDGANPDGAEPPVTPPADAGI